MADSLRLWKDAGRPQYEKASKALEEAHKACFNHPDRDILGMSHGPFSGVNEALGIVAELEQRALIAEYELEKLKEEKNNE